MRADAGALLHNMGAPPWSTIRYAGLGQVEAGKASGWVPGIVLDRGRPADDPGAIPLPPDIPPVGVRVRFRLPTGRALRRPSHGAILAAAGIPADGLAPRARAAAAASAIARRAAELPLPDACVIVSGPHDRESPWADLLSALAVLCACNRVMWMRAREPSIRDGIRLRSVTLLVPPTFTHLLPPHPQEIQP